jgi:hypothetical protein
MIFTSFICLYTSAGTHAGIQHSHGAMEMVLKYQDPSPEHDMLHDWMNNHKTVHVRQAGFQGNISRIHDEIADLVKDLHYPFAKFHESIEALNGSCTCAAVIMPEAVFSPLMLDDHGKLLPPDVLVRFPYGAFLGRDLKSIHRLRELTRQYKFA